MAFCKNEAKKYLLMNDLQIANWSESQLFAIPTGE